MTTVVMHSWYMAKKSIMNLLRQPWYILITLIQPIIWLLLFGALFRRIVELPGFGATSYIDYLAPGVVVMTILFSAGWSGYSFIEELNRGLVDRFLVTPISRAALIWGPLIQGALVSLVQAAILLGLAAIKGASFPGGALGVLILLVASILLGIAVGAISHAIAVLSRREETMIAVSNFVLLPLTFLSSVFMASTLMPGWMQSISHYNPVNWAVEAGRSALTATPDWGLIWPRLAALAGLMIVCTWLSTLAFRSYQKSI